MIPKICSSLNLFLTTQWTNLLVRNTNLVEFKCFLGLIQCFQVDRPVLLNTGRQSSYMKSFFLIFYLHLVCCTRQVWWFSLLFSWFQGIFVCFSLNSFNIYLMTDNEQLSLLLEINSVSITLVPTTNRISNFLLGTQNGLW